MNEDPHISIDYIVTILDISHDSVDTILKQHLPRQTRAYFNAEKRFFFIDFV